MPVAELFLGAFLQVLFDRLASRELLNFARRGRIDAKLKEWKKMLFSIKQLLEDAEDKQLNGDPGVKSWLEDLRNLAYDIEDLLDDFAAESVEKKSKKEPGTSNSCFLLPCSGFGLEFTFDNTMKSRIEEMDRRLREIIALKDDLSLKENNGKRSAYRLQDKPLPTTHLAEECFVGREDKKMEMLELLTGEEDDRICADKRMIAIVGMPGLGKTALVQQVFNDARVTRYFNVKAWACVSDDFNVLAITKDILQKTNHRLSCEGKDLDWLQGRLKENLKGKKFLIVLDDVWNENYHNWTTLLKPFQDGKKGSKIIVTTRDLKVASIAGALPVTLEVLSLDACMTLFTFHALRARNFDHPKLEEFGRQIAKKCKGLPLAVKTMAGLLRTKDSPHEWEAILKSKIWDLPKEGNDILPALKLSYLHLHYHLRRCFAYCAIFPKDCEIQRDELIRWWIAEGLVEGKDGRSRWNVGLNYFNELVSRSLFQKSSSNGSEFFMHDLVNDLAKLAAGANHFDSGEFEGDPNNVSFVRHASFISDIFDDHVMPKRVEIYHQMKQLRSFISLRKQSGYLKRSFLSQEVLFDLLSRLKYLRVLSLSHYYISEVPNCIGKLRHLRHLNLSYTDVEKLPKSIVTLYNLEALMLRGCHFLTKLPEDMEKLINLRFLDITDTSLRALPLHIGNLVGLEMLSNFMVGTENGPRLTELKNLNNLQEELCISNLHEVQEAEDAKDANLYKKEGIRRLTLQWSGNSKRLPDEEPKAKVLDFLRPHQNLETLTISYYGGLEFPSWFGSPSYDSIVRIRLHGCRRVKVLPSLGQLRSLKELEFKDMPSWEDWSQCVEVEEDGVLFPCLEHLIIQDCPKLIGSLPSQLSSLITLKINACPRMNASPSITSLPSLKELNFQGCKEGVLKSLANLASLITLVIKDVVDLTCLNHGFTSSLIKLEKLEMSNCEKLMYLWQDKNVKQNLDCLKSLVIDKCREFISFAAGEGDIELPSNLETIKLTCCSNLEKLPSKIHTLSSLTHLTIYACPKLVAFPETGIPTSVISLTIGDCKTLRSLPMGLGILPEEPSGGGSNNTRNNHADLTSCLQELRILECNSLPASPFGRFLPATLERLGIWRCSAVESLAEINVDRLQSLQEIEIHDCENLRSLPQGLDTMSHLTSLKIHRCDSLPASPFSKGRFLPATLRTLKIVGCKGVESLAEINADGPQSLREIEISDCDNLRSLPQGLHMLSHLTSLILDKCPALELECFPPLPPGILKFSLYRCPKIRSLPNQLRQLTDLRDLSIDDCESITRFPDGGLPPQLQRLVISNCRNLKQQQVRECLTKPRLTSLQTLHIGGGVGEEEDLVLPLPSSLQFLRISNMRMVERLSSPLPPSLRTLEINNCPKLTELPHDDLPPSLEELWIERCPILEERCRKGTDYYWPLICQIPHVGLSDTGCFGSITN